MNPDSQLQASMWLMIVVQTIGAMDLPGHGPRKLPAPKVYVLIIVLWSIFGILSDAGAGKVAALMSWVTVLTAMVMPGSNSAGAKLTGLMKLIGQRFATTPSSPQPQGTTLT